MSPVWNGCAPVTRPSSIRQMSSPSSTTLAKAAWKNAVCVRKQPAARGELGKEQDRQRAAGPPPAIITSAMHITSPKSSVETSGGSDNAIGSRWIQTNVTSPNTK
jgi:hypothetical protein